MCKTLIYFCRFGHLDKKLRKQLSKTVAMAIMT
jgi:hypothetical protein